MLWGYIYHTIELYILCYGTIRGKGIRERIAGK